MGETNVSPISFDVYYRLEVHTEVQEEGVAMARGILAGRQMEVGNVGKAKLIAQFEIELVVLGTAAKLNTHIGAVEVMIGTLAGSMYLAIAVHLGEFGLSGYA